MQRLAERLEAGLVAAAYDVHLPGCELGATLLLNHRTQRLVGPRHRHVQAGRTLVQASLYERESLVEPEAGRPRARRQELLLNRGRGELVAKRLLDEVGHKPIMPRAWDATRAFISPVSDTDAC